MMLLETDDQKKLDLLLILLQDRFKNPLTIADLSQKMKIDKRTLSHLTEDLIQDLEMAKCCKDIQLSIENAGVIALKVQPAFDENQLIAYYSKQSTTFNLVLDLLLNRFSTVEDFTAKNFISSSAFYRKMDKIKPYLEDLRICLNLNRPGGFLGSERQVRLFYFYLLADIEKYLDFPCAFSLDNQFPFFQFSSLWLNITYYRLAGEHYICSLDEADLIVTFPTKEEEFLKIIQNELAGFFDSFDLNPETISLEIKNLYTFFSTMQLAFVSCEELSRNKIAFDKIQSTIEKKSLLWVHLFADFFHLDIPEKEFNYMYYLILNHHIFVYFLRNDAPWFYRNSNFADMNFKDSVLEDQITAFNDFIQATPEFKKYFPEYFGDSSYASYVFITHYFFNRLLTPVRIFIYSQYGPVNEDYLKRTIYQNTSVPVFFPRDPKAEVDLVVTDNVAFFSNREEVINIRLHSIPQPAEFEQIKETIENTYFNRIKLD